MSDEDIKKALEDFYHRAENTNLSYHIFESEREALKDALTLIDRQQAEIDDLKRDAIPKLEYSLKRANKYLIKADLENARQKAEIEKMQKYNAYVAFKHYDEGRTEAIKECVDKYTEMLIDEYHLRTDLQIASIKRVAKKFLAEMVGE